MSSDVPIAVFADFDDTLTTQNVAHFLLKRFAPNALKLYSSQYRSGEITFREYQERSFNSVEASVDEMQEAAANEIELRQGIFEMLSGVDAVGGTFTVASAGLDFYINPVLSRHGLGHLNVVCGTATRDGSTNAVFRYDYPFSQSATGEAVNPCRGDWATCKCKALEQAKKADEETITVFVGDGSTSDACAAEKADHVFARDRLLRICTEKNIAATPFEDFTPVREFIGEMTARNAKYDNQEED